ncbi:MAG: galactose-1-phosphate uridylyltransferase [Candidatus Omnitrophota bacterium]|nr:galactose-1-phosphate uridylyltransferase [Candidatus Omnitrophota bacterium]
MSELRYNMISAEWVIIATERAKRPHDFIKAKKEKAPLPEYSPDCPFCLGNEAQTPDETFLLPGEAGWKVRAVVNKFGALSSRASQQRVNEGLYRSLNGFGSAEVIIEHPRHNTVLALMSQEEVENLIQAYRERYLALKKIKGIQAIVIFKNHGPSAGTSLEHPHSQVIATPIVPPQARDRLRQAVTFFDLVGSCVFCRILEEELKAKQRIILETEHFVAFMPYAALSPFHIWIFPRRHMPSFCGITDAEAKDLALNLKSTLAKLYYGLDNPDYNFTIRSTPVNEAGGDYFHWYISVIPRVSQPAGFELGSGMFINTALPEESAGFLRGVR